MTKECTTIIFRDDVEIEVRGMVTIIEPWKGSIRGCPSDADWYGYEEVDDLRATDLDGTPIDLTAAEEQLAEEELLDGCRAE